MKRFLVLCSAALALMETTEQKASAWNKFNFNVGLNFGCENAENSLLWGLYRNGPHPYAQAAGQVYGGYGPYGYGGYGNGPYGYGMGGFDVGGPVANGAPMPIGAPPK